MAYAVGGFILLVGLILLFIYLRRRKRNKNRNPDSNGLQMSFENEIYSMEEDNNEDNDHPKSAVNMLYMTREDCQNDINKTSTVNLLYMSREECKNDVTEC